VEKIIIYLNRPKREHLNTEFIELAGDFMKLNSLFGLILLIVALIGCKPSLDRDMPVQMPQVVTLFQQQMLNEINFARTNPSGYAELRLQDAKKDSSDNGSYLYMMNQAPRSPLTFNNTLNLSASNYALFLAEKNLMGHDLNGTPLKRAITSGFEGSSIGENIAASTGDSYDSTIDPTGAAIKFVQIMIIDFGVSDLGHRLTMLNPKYSAIGIGYSKNPASTFVNYNVQDYGAL
jgi:uncharacterized protein YkwD